MEAKARKVCFVGQRFSALLADHINAFAGDELHATSVVIDKATAICRVPSALLECDIWVRIGFRPGSPSPRGFAFDSFWQIIRTLKPRAKTFYYWIGTDVMLAEEDVRRGRTTSFFGRAMRDRHLAGAHWLTDELRAVGIPAETVVPAGVVVNVQPAPHLPSPFTVVSYVPDRRAEFYGGPLIYEAARRLPGVTFLIVGGRGTWAEHPLPNLHFLGWVGSMEQVYGRSSVVVRLVRHDAVGGTVREGLAFARHVIYSYRLPHTRYVPLGDGEALIVTLSEYLEMQSRSALLPNWEGRAYALQTWNPETLTRQLARVLLEEAQ